MISYDKIRNANKTVINSVGNEEDTTHSNFTEEHVVVGIESEQGKKRTVDIHKNFFPSYTPKEMLELGVFGGKYMNDIKNRFPKDWFVKAKMVKPHQPMDASLNYYGVIAGMSLKQWQEHGWIHDTDTHGWFEWYCNYFMGRRIPEEDARQISAWRRFVARHLGMMKKAQREGKEPSDKIKQALLQWAWNYAQDDNELAKRTNQKRILKEMKKYSSNSKFSLEDISMFDAFPPSQVALEDDDNPFAGLDEGLDSGGSDDWNEGGDNEGGEDNPFDSGGDDPFGSSGDDPFASDSNDPFGDGEKRKPVIPELDREKSIKEKFDLSKIIRKDFPGYIYTLQNVIKSSMDVLDRKNVDKDLQKTKEKILEQYKDVLRSVEEYISAIDNERYEDIFTMYVQFWTVLNKLKTASEKVMI